MIFLGQCSCKDHVIGQKCERCEPEYFGFPECKQCSCPPTATCNEETGDCICAPFVTGTAEDPCSECEENTFGYDAITGCQVRTIRYTSLSCQYFFACLVFCSDQLNQYYLMLKPVSPSL